MDGVTRERHVDDGLRATRVWAMRLDGAMAMDGLTSGRQLDRLKGATA